MPGAIAMASVSTSVPEGVSNVVSRTIVSPTYLRSTEGSPRRAIEKWPASRPRSRQSTGGASKRRKHNQSTAPAFETKAELRESDKSA